MAEQKNTKTATVVTLPVKKSGSTVASEKKWGKAVIKLGFSMVPSLIFQAQRRLGLSPTQLNILLQLADYWWNQERNPHPGKATIAERLNLSPRQVQRNIAALEQGGFLKRIERTAAHRGKMTNEYDLGGLVEKLKKLEPEFTLAKEQKRLVTRRGGVLKPAASEELKKA